MNGARSFNNYKTFSIICTLILCAVFSIASNTEAGEKVVANEAELRQALMNTDVTHIDIIPANGDGENIIILEAALPEIKTGVSIDGHNSVLDFNGFSGLKTSLNGEFGGLSNLTLTNASGVKAPAFYFSGSLLNGINNVSFINNNVSGGGLVLRVSNGLSGGINNSRFENSFIGGGANISITGDLAGGINNTVIKHNAGSDLSQYGGNVIISKGHLTGGVNNSLFDGTVTYGNVGGALAINGDPFNDRYGGNLEGGVHNSYFINNVITRNPLTADNITTSHYGGAIGLNGTLSGGIHDSYFIGNKAGISGHAKENGSGGAISAHVISGGIHNSLFQDNGSSKSGGAVFSGNIGTGTGVLYGGIHNSQFINNSAGTQGGAVQIIGMGLYDGIYDSLFRGNTSVTGGGAMVGSTLNGGVYRSEFSNNKTGGIGGAMYIGTLFDGGVHNSLFENNEAGSYGGAFYVNGVFKGGINSSVFRGNKAAGVGGAVGMLTLEGGINDSLFENNESAHRGGAVYVNSLKGGINNSVFKSNHAYGAADAEKSGIGGALSLRGNVEINGGAFINNSADTANIGDLSSGRGGAIFYDAVYDDDKFTLSAADAANPLYFSGNTHNVGGAGATGNSIYFGATALYENLTQGHVDFNLNVAQNAQIVMLDAMASQQDGLLDGDGNAYSNLAVDVTKSGQGTWILAGHNDMRASGHWLIDEGTLQFAGMADGINRPVHIDLQHSDSSFTLSSGASLLVTLETDRHLITAGEITLTEGSYVDLAQSINYGHVADVLHDDYIVLSLQSDSVQNQSQTGSGTVKVGIYDYAYDLHWDGNDLIFNHSQTGAYNHDRAGDAAITAPGVIAFYNPINAELGYRTGDRFRNLNGTRALNNLWATPTYSVVSQHTGGNRVGYDLKTTGMAAGYDFLLGERAFIGIAFSVSRPDYQSRAAKYHGVDTTGVIYGGVVLPYNVELSLFGGYGVTDSNLVRKVEGVKYHTDVEFNAWRAGAELGRRFELTPRFSVRPFASYEYFNVDVESYNEGQGVYNLKVDDYRQEFQRAKIGAELGYVHAESGAYVNMQAYYARNFGDLKARADIAFTQDLTTKYKAVGNPLNKDVIGAGISAGIPLTNKIDLTGSYTFEYGKEAVSQQAGLNLVFRF